MVTGHRATEGGATVVTAQDPENPDTGRLRLVFTGPPVALRQWQVIDAQGAVTTVTLHDMQARADLPDRLFNIQLNTPEGGRR
jgi:outer membrane lipoprotein-sorting protein